ncbi:MAG: helix-turn-helix domain-containing protein [Nitrospirota bacterium]
MANHFQKTNLSLEARKRLKWMDYYRNHSNNASLTCRYFGISRKTFYKWLNLFDPSNLRTLEDRDRTPKNTRKREITPQEESRIISLRKQYLVWGKLKLQRLYQNIYHEKISSWKIQ